MSSFGIPRTMEQPKPLIVRHGIRFDRIKTFIARMSSVCTYTYANILSFRLATRVSVCGTRLPLQLFGPAGEYQMQSFTPRRVHHLS
jgi:hypothetical protein